MQEWYARLRGEPQGPSHPRRSSGHSRSGSASSSRTATSASRSPDRGRGFPRPSSRQRETERGLPAVTERPPSSRRSQTSDKRGALRGPRPATDDPARLALMAHLQEVRSLCAFSSRMMILKCGWLRIVLRRLGRSGAVCD